MPDFPKEKGHIDWLSYRYKDIEPSELFWVEQSLSNNNSPHRKIDNQTATHLREQKVVNIDPNSWVYQKDY
tara:strand:- start:22855 stop:23067 length:213 start_codon:yes stop_codon:yes gene_type:complete